MARITAEDCREVVANGFELVLLASHRAKALGKGAKPTIEKNNDKNAVIALREIADRTVDAEALRNSYVYSLTKEAHMDAHEEHDQAGPSEESELFVAENDAVSVDNFVSFGDEEMSLDEIDAEE